MQGLNEELSDELNNVGKLVRKFCMLNGRTPSVILLGNENHEKIQKEISHREDIGNPNDILIEQLYGIPVRVVSYPKIEIELV